MSSIALALDARKPRQWAARVFLAARLERAIPSLRRTGSRVWMERRHRRLPDAVCRQPWKNLLQAVWIARLWTYNSRPARQSQQSGHPNQEEPTTGKRLNKQELIDAVKSQIAEKRPDITKVRLSILFDGQFSS
ncbi:MAG: hypothetical protein NTX45_00665 [Proteobacteria bacterium]|nr:hypothetical protein [Pseudomonadota bacterium]